MSILGYDDQLALNEALICHLIIYSSEPNLEKPSQCYVLKRRSHVHIKIEPFSARTRQMARFNDEKLKREQGFCFVHSSIILSYFVYRPVSE